jgi:hypothetical protein
MGLFQKTAIFRIHHLVIDPDVDSQLRVVCPKGFNPVEGRNFREFVCHNGNRIQETILTQKVRVAKAGDFRENTDSTDEFAMPSMTPMVRTACR